jgi:hypothetical protein
MKIYVICQTCVHVLVDTIAVRIDVIITSLGFYVIRVAANLMGYGRNSACYPLAIFYNAKLRHITFLEPGTGLLILGSGLRWIPMPFESQPVFLQHIGQLSIGSEPR